MILGDKLATCLISNMIEMVKEYTGVSVDEVLGKMTSATLTNVLTELSENDQWKSLINLRQRSHTRPLL